MYEEVVVVVKNGEREREREREREMPHITLKEATAAVRHEIRSSYQAPRQEQEGRWAGNVKSPELSAPSKNRRRCRFLRRVFFLNTENI